MQKNDGALLESRHGSSPELSAKSRLELHDSLTRLGNVYELDFQMDVSQTRYELKTNFPDSWTQYNPYKQNNPRFGLSLTSLDGKLGGDPDLYPLREYHRREKVLYQESDFRTLTEVYQKVPSIRPLIDYFHPYLGRSHFLKFNAGGYFPPHRDGAGTEAPYTFRILAPIGHRGASSHVFLYDDKRLILREDSVYFMNTLITHSLFSFSENVIYLVCNVILNEETVARVKARLLDK